MEVLSTVSRKPKKIKGINLIPSLVIRNHVFCCFFKNQSIEKKNKYFKRGPPKHQQFPHISKTGDVHSPYILSDATEVLGCRLLIQNKAKQRTRKDAKPMINCRFIIISNKKAT